MRQLLSFLFVCVALTAVGGNLDIRTRARLSMPKIEPARAAGDASDHPYYPMILRVESTDELEQLGAIIWGQRGDIVICSVPTDSVECLSESESIIAGTIATRLDMAMDMARPSANADCFISASMPDLELDGSGVVAGFCDTGFDATHIAFDGRVGLSLQINEFEGTEKTFRVTDSVDECHATHVAGIMAGGYRGNGYRGVAPAATIAATTSQLTDIGVLAGMERIIEYARSEGCPAVINVSLGSYTGPHDGTTLFNRYLEALADEAIIVMAAGNTGKQPYTLSHTFRGNDEWIATRISTWDNLHPSGCVDLWSDTADDFCVSFGIWDNDERCWVMETSRVGTGARSSWILTTNEALTPEITGRMVAHYADFSRLFNGYVMVDSEVDAENGRFHLLVNHDFSTDILSADGAWARYTLALRVHGGDGQTINIFSDGVKTRLTQLPIPQGREGNSSMSISDMACGNGVISVGMTVSRTAYPVSGTEPVFTNEPLGRISPHSAYGFGLPHISAPGCHVVSALSGPYLIAGHTSYPLVDVVHQDGTDYAWTAMMGTSMATPMVAGTIACWLQAHPGLTHAQALAALRESAAPRAPGDDPVRYGSGGILNAAGGLAWLDRMASIDSVESDKIHVADSIICATGRIEVYTLQGLRVASATDTFDTSTLPRGFYFVTSPGAGAEKICVR